MGEHIRVKVARRPDHHGGDVVEILDAADDVILMGERSPEEGVVDLVDLTEEPDVVVLDLGVEGAEAGELTRRVAAEHPSARVLVLSGSDARADLAGAVRAGARGYLVRPARRRDLEHAVRLVAAGHMVIDVRFAGRPIPVPRPRVSAEERLLTDREVEILVLASSGYGDQDIAERLGVTSVTVRRNLARICAKLEVPDREAAIARAAVTGIPSTRSAGLVWIREVPVDDDPS